MVRLSKIPSPELRMSSCLVKCCHWLMTCDELSGMSEFGCQKIGAIRCRFVTLELSGIVRPTNFLGTNITLPFCCYVAAPYYCLGSSPNALLRLGTGIWFVLWQLKQIRSKLYWQWLYDRLTSILLDWCGCGVLPRINHAFSPKICG